MTCGTRQKVKRARNVVVTMNNTNLQIVPTYKYLGFTFDSTLSFNCQVQNVANMVTYKTNLFAKIRKYLTSDVALQIYKSINKKKKKSAEIKSRRPSTAESESFFCLEPPGSPRSQLASLLILFS